MRTLLQIAHTSAKQAETYLDFKRPDLAYVEYLTASNIVVELVPRHKDFPSLNADRGELWRLNKDIRNVSRFLEALYYFCTFFPPTFKT